MLVEFLNPSECSEWLVSNGYQVDSKGRPVFEGPPLVRSALPEIIGRRIASCRSLWLGFFADQTSLLWITDWGVWPSGEHLPLANALRMGLGATKELAESPGVVVTPNTSDHGLSLLMVAASFLDYFVGLGLN